MGGVEQRDFPLSANKLLLSQYGRNYSYENSVCVSPGANERVCLLCANDTGHADYSRKLFKFRIIAMQWLSSTNMTFTLRFNSREIWRYHHLRAIVPHLFKNALFQLPNVALGETSMYILYTCQHVRLTWEIFTTWNCNIVTVQCDNFMFQM